MADARSRNRERYRSAKAAKCAAMRAAKARKREEEGVEREPAWKPPALRRIVVVIDFDSGRPRVRMMQLWRGDRIDRYKARSPKGDAKSCAGWSRALAAVRKGMPRARMTDQTKESK